MKVFFVYHTNDGRPFYVGKGNAERVRRKERNALLGLILQAFV